MIFFNKLIKHNYFKNSGIHPSCRRCEISSIVIKQIINSNKSFQTRLEKVQQLINFKRHLRGIIHYKNVLKSCPRWSPLSVEETFHKINLNPGKKFSEPDFLKQVGKKIKIVSKFMIFFGKFSPKIQNFLVIIEIPQISF